MFYIILLMLVYAAVKKDKKSPKSSKKETRGRKAKKKHHKEACPGQENDSARSSHHSKLNLWINSVEAAIVEQEQEIENFTWVGFESWINSAATAKIPWQTAQAQRD